MTTSKPGLEIDNSIPAIVWADGETTPCSVTFRVPADYVSGGAFAVIADESTGDATPCQIDFEVYVNADGSPFDASVSNQTPVALSYDPGTPDVGAGRDAPRRVHPPRGRPGVVGRGAAASECGVRRSA